MSTHRQLIDADDDTRTSASLHLVVDSSSSYLSSEMEERILKSTKPIPINNNNNDSIDEIILNGERGVLVNRDEILNWKPNENNGVPITEYPINTDDSPVMITKPSEKTLEYTQDVFIRYLRPPTPPEPGEIVIQEMASDTLATVPPPPLVIRQQPPRPITPEPLVIRERPPAPPPLVGRKLITIPAQALPPPPRKVIVEQLPAVPPKPQMVLVERWLPYTRQKRRVIYKKMSSGKESEMRKPKNIIIQWEAPRVHIHKKVIYLGIVRANPQDYARKFSSDLISAELMPAEVRHIEHPHGLVLAAENNESSTPELYGDVNALMDVDLEREGLAEYRPQIETLRRSHVHEYLSPSSPPTSPPNNNNNNNNYKQHNRNDMLVGGDDHDDHQSLSSSIFTASSSHVMMRVHHIMEHHHQIVPDLS